MSKLEKDYNETVSKEIKEEVYQKLDDSIVKIDCSDLKIDTPEKNNKNHLKENAAENIITEDNNKIDDEYNTYQVIGAEKSEIADDDFYEVEENLSNDKIQNEDQDSQGYTSVNIIRHSDINNQINKNLNSKIIDEDSKYISELIKNKENSSKLKNIMKEISLKPPKWAEK